jgi:molecular chaperone GrpE (heat shock protein)
MDRSLTPIREDDQLGSSDTTPYEDLPTVTPVVRTFTDTIQRQNAENEALKKKILKLQATLNNTREELNETTSMEAQQALKIANKLIFTLNIIFIHLI